MTNDKPLGRPIYGTDVTKPVPELIEDWRDQLTHIRGQISDVQHLVGFKETFDPVSGLITCGIENLFHIGGQIEKLLAARAREKV